MDQIGKYKIVDVLGKGGMGVVYKAHDPIIDRDVAIKVLPKELFDMPEIKERFYREARALGRLSHENITIVHDLGEVEDQPYIVMEFLSGTDLRTIIKKKTKLSLNQKIDIAVQICKGLRFSHSRNIIHRDIKPENIRILDNERVKILDFGIAKSLTSTMTITGNVIGTPHYMSPEQIKGEKIDLRSDIFSFGILFYEFLLYRLPFPGDNFTTVSYKIVHENPEPILNFDGENIPMIRELTMKCLEKDREKRYKNFSDVIKDLEIIHDQSQSANVQQPFDNDDMQTILRQESETKKSKKIKPQKSTSFFNKPTFYIPLAASIILVFLLYRFFFYAPSVKEGRLALDVLPWAEVTKVINENNEEVQLIETNNKIVTPCFLTFGAGNYQIFLKNSTLNDSTTVKVKIEPGKTQKIIQKMPAFNYTNILTKLGF